jgi:hypothetical protein
VARHRKLERGDQVFTPTGRRAEVEAVEGDRADRRVKLRYLDQAGGGVELRDDSILKPARGRRVRTD